MLPGVRPLAVHRLGRMAYGAAHELQVRLHQARQRGEIPDTLLLLEHDPVITLGRGAKREHVLATAETLERMGYEVHETGRGGDVTYHGPGQLVAYPLLDLNPDRRDVRRYVAMLEQTMIGVCAAFGLEAHRVAGLNGAWIGERKIGAVGTRISRWVTMHGFAFNVATDLDRYAVIVPCGIHDRGVTSLERELGRSVEMAEAEEATIRCFSGIFEAAPEHSTLSL